jgi:hypothetical protein
VGLLSGVCRTLPNPYLLSRSLMRRESVLSSRIEGTQVSGMIESARIRLVSRLSRPWGTRGARCLASQPHHKPW